MKRILSYLIVLLVLSHSGSLYSQTVQWAKRGISQGYDYGNAIAVDDSGNAYISGQIEYTTNFDGVSLTTNGIHDIFAGKYGADGSIKWLKHAGGTGGDVAYGVGVDASHNCYVSGEVEQTATFGNGFSVTSAGSNDIFLARYDINGNVTRLQRWGSAGNDKSRALAVSPSGECYLTGYYSDGMTFGSVSLSHAGGNDVYIAKINSSGTVLWVKRGGGGNDDRGYGIAYDKSGNVFVSGVFNTSATFSGTTVSNGGVNGAYTVKYDANGNFKWIKKGGSNSADAEANCIAIDENDFIYSAGYFTGTATFGSTTLTSAGSTDIFLVKYDQSGNVIWAKSAGGPYEDIAYGLTIDTIIHRVLMTGQIDDHGYFGTHYCGGAGNRDVIIASFDTDGNADWVKCYGGDERDIGYAIAKDKNGNIFTTGIYNESATFESFVLNGYLLSDFYIEKTSPAPAAQPTVQSSALILSHIDCNDLELTFTKGNGAGRMIVARAGSAVNATPSDGNSYNANSVFGAGTNLGNGNYVVYNGSGEEVTITGLTQGVTYYFKIFEYNGYAGSLNYLTTSPPAINGVSGSVTLLLTASANEMCAGDSVLLTVQGAATYSWSPALGLSAVTGNSVFASPSTGTTYTVVGTDSQGCQSQSSVALIVHAIPSVSLISPAAMCIDAGQVLLTGGLPAGGNYSGQGVTGNSFDPSLTGDGTFNLCYTYTNSEGCSDSATSTITVNPLPLIHVNPIPSVCESSTPIALNFASPAGGVYSGAGVVGNNFDPGLTGAGSFILHYTYTNSNGCLNTAQTSIIVNPLPVITIGGNLSFCENEAPVTLVNAIPAGGVYSGAGVTFGVLYPIAGNGDYLINYYFTDSMGCSSTTDYYLHILVNPVVDLGLDTTLCADNSIVLYADTGFSYYEWSNGEVSPSVVIDSNGVGIGQYQYWVTVTAANGCESSDTINITFDLCAGINDAEVIRDGIEIYPNPFNENFYLQSDEVISYFIYSSDGKLIDYKREFSGLTTLGDSYSQGVYFITVQFRSHSKVLRLVKAKS